MSNARVFYKKKIVLSNRVDQMYLLTNTKIETLLNQETMILGTKYAISQVRRFLRYQNVIPSPKSLETNNSYSNYPIFHE